MTSEHLAAADVELSPPFTVVDPATKTTYVLVRADIYEKMSNGLDSFDPRDTYPFVDDVMREDDTRDPTLAHYQGESSDRRVR